MPSWTWVILIPTTALVLTLWHRSLLTAFPAIVVCYATFLVALFKLAPSVVGITWLLFAVLTVPVVWTKFPGQYNVKRSFSALGFWPVMIVFALIAEDMKADSSLPSDIPGQISGRISFIESAGSEPNYLFVFLEEFGDTAFFCPMEAETEPGINEESEIEAHVEYRSFPDLSEDDVLWLSEIRLKS